MADTASHIVHLLPLKMALIGGLGIGAQWLAWKLQKPAIVLMALAGLIFGPLIGFLQGFNMPEALAGLLDALRLNPAKDFGDLLRPVIGISVAIILFEGGLTLKFSELRDASKPVRRMILFAGPISWLLGTFAAHYIVNLPWDISAMVGGLFVVTGPTVIIPLLRQAHLSDRVASGYGLAWAFRKGHIPEYLKAPVVMAWVLLIYVLANELAEETGLLAVTAMGITMANTKYAAMVEMRRFKETIAVLLVSGVFVILTATLTPPVIKSFVSDPKIAHIYRTGLCTCVCHRSGLQLHGNAYGENSGIGDRDQRRHINCRRKPLVAGTGQRPERYGRTGDYSRYELATFAGRAPRRP